MLRGASSLIKVQSDSQVNKTDSTTQHGRKMLRLQICAIVDVKPKCELLKQH